MHNEVVKLYREKEGINGQESQEHGTCGQEEEHTGHPGALAMSPFVHLADG